MKQISFLLLAFFMLSCGADVGHYSKTDTVRIPRVNFRIVLPTKVISGDYIDSIVMIDSSKYEFKDVLKTSGGHWVRDTFAFGRIVVDTLRDSLKRPLFDTAHKPLMNTLYYPIPSGYWQKNIVPTILPIK